MENASTLPPAKRKHARVDRLIAQWEQSGQSKTLFCREQQIKLSTFHGWFSRRKKHALKNQAMPGFVSVQLKKENSNDDCFAEINFPNGIRLNLFQPVGAAYLRGLLTK